MRQRGFLVALALALVLALWPPMARPTEAQGEVYTVNTVEDQNDADCHDADCSLRDAIIEANNHDGPDTIEFDIPGCSGVCTIQLSTALQYLSGGGTTIDGYTQPGAVEATDTTSATLKIEIDGTNAGATAQGFYINSAGNVIKGIVINRFRSYGIRITGSGATSNTISGNYIGTNASGTADLGNALDGVLIDYGAQNNTVGGDEAGERNVISGNNGSDGVGISGSGTISNTVSGNYIGTDANGTTDLGNTSSGAYIGGGAQNNTIEQNVISGNGSDGVGISGSNTMSNTVSGNTIGTDASGASGLGNGGEGVYIGGGAQNNTIGGDTDGERNVISDNDSDGIRISGSGATGNTVSGNYIGTDASGTAGLGNRGYGVYIGEGAQNNTVGGDTDGERNVISGNNSSASTCGVGISGSGTTNNTVSGNYIGMDASGTADRGNLSGVCVGGGAQNNTVGGDTDSERNVISGNDRYGVEISGSGTTGNTVSGNYIGTDASGTTDRGNTYDGISISSSAQNNTIEQNVISGNDRGGVLILSTGTTGNIVSGNHIGTDASGTADLSNTLDGVYISWGAQNNTIGPDNVISGNDRYGVYIHRSGTMSNTVSGNTIGTNISGTAVLSNTLHGVYIYDGAQNNTIGGDTDSERNVISGNGSDGVRITGSGTTGNTISGNTIGTDASGTADLGNGEHGVYISGAQNNTVGGDTAGERNVISGNDECGIWISGSGTMSNTVSGNTIGTNASGTAGLGNGWYGVFIRFGARNNTVGPDNVIAHNVLDGVAVDGNSTTGNTVTQNSIFSNRMGIELTNGANGGIAAPAIVTTTVGSVNVVGTACAGCTVEVFENSDTDGEGKTYVGDTTAAGSGAFTVTVSSLGNPYLTATATDARGTSEFSAVFTSTLAGGKVYLPIILKSY